MSNIKKKNHEGHSPKYRKKIYEHFALEKKKLEIIDAQMDSQNLLSDDEKDAIESQLIENESDIKNLSSLRKSNLKEISYYEDMNSLEKKKNFVNFSDEQIMFILDPDVIKIY